MKETSTRFGRFCTSWKFFLVLIALQFVLMPMATKGFRFEEAGQIVFTTLGHALINRFYPYSFVFQWMALALIVALLFFRDRIGRFFSAYVGCCYLLYAIIQSIAVTNKYGVSVVTVNLVMMLFVAFVWFRDSWKGENKYTFSNLNWKTAWLVPVAFSDESTECETGFQSRLSVFRFCITCFLPNDTRVSDIAYLVPSHYKHGNLPGHCYGRVNYRYL